MVRVAEVGAESALRSRERRLRLLADTAAGLLAAADPDEVLGPVFRSLSEEFGVDISFSYVAEEDGGGLRLASCFGLPEESRAGFERLALGQAVCGAAAQARRAVHVADARASGDPAAAAIRALGVRAYVAFPLVAGDRLLGTVSFGSGTAAGFSGEDLAFLGAIAQHLAVVRERLRTEAALRGSEARFRALARASSDVLYRMSPDWSEMRQLSGGGFLADAAEPTRGWLEDYIHPDDQPAVQAAIGEAVRTKGVFELEHRVRRPDGSLGWTHSRAVPVPGADGEVVEWFGAASDVTARREAEARLAALVELGDRLRDLRDPAEITRTAAEVTGRTLGAARAGYGAVDAAEEAIAVERDWTDGSAASVTGVHRLHGYWTGFADALRRGEAVAVADAALDPRTAPHADNYAALGVRACVQVPILRGGRVAAILYVHDAAPRRWTPEEVAFARGVAERAWAAADRARSEAALRAHAARQAFRLAFEERLRALADPDAIMGEAVALLGRHLGADRVGYSEIIDDAVVRAAGSYAANGVAPLHEDFPIGVFGEAMVARQRRGITEVSDDVLADPERAGDVWAAIDTRSVVSVPLVRGGRFRASLYVNNRGPRRWAAEDVALVEEVAARTWDAAERARAEAALRESEGRRRAALDAARLGTWEWDTATDAVTLDERSREIFGLPPSGGGRAEEVFGRIHPGDLPRVLAESLAAAAAKARLETEYRVPLPGGGERAVASLGDALPGAAGRAARMVGVFADITERKRAEERRALLVNELNHRVKNTLAVVQSLALQTARGAADLPAFTAAFQARLIALARAHDLLTQRDWEGAPLGEVARAALEPVGGGARVDVSCGCGDRDALLTPAQALAVAMALHELATNAIKHGALSAPGGRVTVRCGPEPGGGGGGGPEPGGRALEWLERGGPPVSGPPPRRGFGLRLIQRGLAAQAGMDVDLRFEPDGLRCAFRLPPAR